MLCNPISSYPNKIDEMIFFQDNNLEKVEVMNHYNELITQGKYTEASDYISQQSNFYGYFADFFNLIENRIESTQEYLLSKPPKKQPIIYYNKDENFTVNELHLFSNTDVEENISSIELFSDNDDEEFIDDLHLFTGKEGEPPNANKGTIWI